MPRIGTDWDQRRREVRVTRKQIGGGIAEADYSDETLGLRGAFRIECLKGMELPVDWWFVEPRPTVRAALDSWE